MSNGLLVIKLNEHIRNDDYLFLFEQFRLQKEHHGVVLLPPYCEAIYVPDDVEIKLEKKES